MAYSREQMMADETIYRQKANRKRDQELQQQENNMVERKYINSKCNNMVQMFNLSAISVIKLREGWNKKYDDNLGSLHFERHLGNHLAKWVGRHAASNNLTVGQALDKFNAMETIDRAGVIVSCLEL